MTFTRKLVALAATAFAAALVPTFALGGAAHQTDSWTNEPTGFFSPNACVQKQVTGTGVESGTAWITDTPNGGGHVHGEIHGTVALYEVLGPGPWDPQPGAYVGTWTYDGKFSDQASPSGAGALSGTSHGLFVFADGHSAVLSSKFHLTFESFDAPPKVFFAHFSCGGEGSFN